MIFFSFVVQLFFAFVFFAGISGTGILVLRTLKIKKSNIFLEFSLGFFVSLTLFAVLSVLLLFVVPNKLAVLVVFTILYFLLSFVVLIRRFWTDSDKKLILPFFKEYWSICVALVLSIFFFFLEIYRTALLDEWLHRPIVKFFTENGIFPLRNPFNPAEIFIYSYHYGTQIIGSALKLIFSLGVSESLDVMKLAFFIASFLLFFGLIFEWSKSKWYSLFGAVFVILCGGSFFLFDNFSTSHVAFWGQSVGRPFNYSLSFCLAGITWVNIPLSVAFLWLLEKYFLKREEDFGWSFFLFAPLLVGFFLISELFGILMIGFIVFLILLNLRKGNISKKNIYFGLFFFAIFFIGMLASGGVVASIFEKSRSLKGLAVLRGLDSWGYPTEAGIIVFSQSLMRYLKDFLLEIVIAATIIFGLIKRKISVSDHPLFFLAVPITFLIPFVVSTSMGNLNLYKLTALGILVLHLLFFYYFSLNKRAVLFYVLIVLFVFGSLPIVFFDFNTQIGNSAWAQYLRCVENDLCYDPAEASFLMEFEKNHPGVKYFYAAKQDQQIIVDLTNSFAVRYTGVLDSETLKKRKIEYIFDTPNLESLLDENAQEELKRYEPVGQSGDYRILRAY
ncbi:MAG: hypothetical protein NT093_01840 [Candidatus Moranbacteria bacterium]|nr:hypothetical protein [Candidatus Moranbacteria bacterium]